jgi:hypothetical protein
MSAFGTKRTSLLRGRMSALVSKAEIERMVYLIDGDDFASRLERCIEPRIVQS